MKRYFVLFAIGLCLLACKKDEPNGPGKQDYPEPVAGTAYVLEGTVNTPGFTWSTNSSVGLYSAMTEVKASNLECKIEGWADTGLMQEDPETGKMVPVPYTPSQYDGQAVAPFNTPALDLVKGENSFLVYTPYDPTLKYVAGVIYGLEIAEDQTQPKPDVAGAGFAFGTCKGIPGVDEKFSFSLNPVSAVAKVKVSSAEFADYGVKKVILWDETGAAKLGGGFNVNIESNEFQTLTSYSRVSTTVSAPATLGTKEQSVYVNILPGTYNDLYVIVELTGEKGNVTIPIKKSGLSFTGGQTTEIVVSDLKSSDNSIDWYCPVETRMQSGLGYAYGDANTYLIQCKSGSTWHGATYKANADIPDEVTIDYRARGSFFEVEAPVDVTFEWFENNGTVYTSRTAQYEESEIDPTKLTFTQNAAEYKVTVKNTGAYAGAPILVMKKGERILWAWSFWNIAADGTTLGTVNVGGKKLANMDIGQPTTQYSQWIKNSAYNNFGKETQSKVAPDVIYRFNYYYQFGRPIPVFWTTYWTFTWDAISPHYTGTGNCPAIEGPIDFATANAHPVGMVLAWPDPTDMPSWCSDGRRGDLWGGNVHADEEAEGQKSIYDPCPKGWRVPDPSTMKALKDAADNATYENTTGIVGFYLDGSLFHTNGYGNGKTAGNGRLASMGMGQQGTTGAASHGMLWSNYIGGYNLNQPVSFYWRNESNKSGNRVGKYNSSVAASVRCQVDESNR